MARRSHRAGVRVQAARMAAMPVHAHVPHVRLFIDRTVDATLATLEQGILSDGNARRKSKAARMVDTRYASGIAGGCSIRYI